MLGQLDLLRYWFSGTARCESGVMVKCAHDLPVKCRKSYQTQSRFRLFRNGCEWQLSGRWLCGVRRATMLVPRIVWSSSVDTKWSRGVEVLSPLRRSVVPDHHCCRQRLRCAELFCSFCAWNGTGSCIRSLETPRDGVRIRRSGQILRFAFHGSVDHGFVAGCEPSCGGQLIVCFSCWPFDRRSCIGNTTFRSACMATGIFVSISLGRPIFMWSSPKRFHSPTWDFAVSSTSFACQWTSNIVPVTFSPSSTYSNLTKAISKMFLSVRQDVHARMSGLSMRLNVPAQGSTTILCDT